MKVDKKLRKKMVAFLNECLDLDREAMSNLVNLRVICNADLGEHPTIQTGEVSGDLGGYEVGLLGILNGLCGIIQKGEHEGEGPIVSRWEGGQITQFAENK